jgi:hypothetical protein
MKSPDPLDPVRLSLRDSGVYTNQDHEVEISVTFLYQPWEPSAAQDVLLEQLRAIDCLSQVLQRGGLSDEGF